MKMDILVNLVFFLLGASLSFAILWYQEREPNLSVRCNLSSSSNPAEIICEIENTGRAESKDIYIGFNRMLPLQTTLISEPEVGAELVPSNDPPDPNIFQQSAEFRQAFAVRIPRVPTGETVAFRIITRDPDNIRAADQVLRIWGEIDSRLNKFGKMLLADHPEYQDRWSVDDFMSAISKRDNFFTPGRFTYENGTQDIEFISRNERLADATVDDLTKRFEKQYSHIFKGSKDFKAPVIKIKVVDGERTFASSPPFVKTRIEFRVPSSKLAKGKPISVQPSIPKSYE
jgi:hypothetical protein